jgi:hypothetical protein
MGSFESCSLDSEDRELDSEDRELDSEDRELDSEGRLWYRLKGVTMCFMVKGYTVPWSVSFIWVIYCMGGVYSFTRGFMVQRN